MKLTVNGVERAAEVPGLKRLLDVLREDLKLTGTKEGCGEGECGACSVILDGELVNSCLVAACQADGASVVTVEGLSSGPLQRAFVEHGAAQCGICTPGMVVAAERFLRGGAEATDASVREAIAGNLCRCTGYAKIVEAIQAASAVRR
ncbi:MAG TPA: (2Fe-2S)-binding protein [Myxococcales bacterium]|nr:(2Fe-2S)-binding protein [Myxococcales bacterium]